MDLNWITASVRDTFLFIYSMSDYIIVVDLGVPTTIEPVFVGVQLETFLRCHSEILK